MRIVLDTNVIISGLLFDGVPEKVVIEALAGKAQHVSSPFIIEEISRILRNKFNVQADDLKMLQKILGNSDLQYFQPYLSILTDGPDNRVIETAEQGKADYIITGDKLLLGLKSYKKIKIIKPIDFLSLTTNL